MIARTTRTTIRIPIGGSSPRERRVQRRVPGLRSLRRRVRADRRALARWSSSWCFPLPAISIRVGAPVPVTVGAADDHSLHGVVERREVVSSVPDAVGEQAGECRLVERFAARLCRVGVVDAARRVFDRR
jgi:hypothetical protein